MIKVFFLLFICVTLVKECSSLKAYSTILHRHWNSTSNIKQSAITTDNQYVIGAADSRFLIWERETNQLITEVPQVKDSKDSIKSVELTQDNRYGVFSFGIGGIWIYDLSDPKIPVLQGKLDLGHDVADLSINRVDQGKIACVGKGKLTLVDISDKKNPKKLHEIKVKGSQDHVVITDNGQYVALTQNDYGWVIYNWNQILKGNYDLAKIYEWTLVQNIHDIAVSYDGKKVFMTDVYQGLYYFDLSAIETKPQLTDADVQKYFLEEEMQYSVWGMAISKDGNTLVYGKQIRGVTIVDVSKLPKFRILQMIGGMNNQPFEMAFSEDEDFIVISAMKEIIMVDQKEFALSQTYPNFFNSHQSIKIYVPVAPGAKVGNPVRLSIYEEKSLVGVGYSQLGSFLIDVKNPYRPKVLSTFPGPETHDGIIFMDTKPVAIVATTQHLAFWNIQDPANPVMLNNFVVATSPSQIPDTDDPIKTKDDQYVFVANGPSGTAVINIEDPSNPKIVGWTNPDLGTGTRILLDSKESVLFMVSRPKGVWVVDVSNKNNMNMSSISLAKSQYGHSIALATDDRFLFIGQLMEGVAVWNVADPKNISLQRVMPTDLMTSRLNIINYVTTNYLIVSGRFKSIFNLFNVSDSDAKNFQLIFRTDQYPEDSTEVVVDQRKQYAYAVLDNLGFRMFPTISRVQITNQVEEITLLANNSESQVRIGEIDNLLVGKKYLINLNAYNYTTTSRVKTVEMYEDFLVQPLPNYITYNPDLNQLVLIVDQTLVKNRRATSSLNILFTMISKCPYTSFIDTQYGITEQMAKEIHENLRYYNYLDPGDFPTDVFTSSTKYPQFRTIGVITDYLDPNVQAIIRQVLMLATNRYLLTREIAPSLKVNFSSTPNFIETISHNFEIVIKFLDVSQAIFVSREIIGATINYNDQKSGITVSGKRENIFRIFAQEIKYYVKSSMLKDEEIIVQVNLDDFANLPYSIEIPLIDLKFLKQIEKFPVRHSLQDQYNMVNQGGNAYVNSEFTFQFSQETWIPLTGLKLTYRSEYKEPGEDWKEFGKEVFWFVFNQNQRFYTGKAPNTYFGKSIEIRLFATDGYTTNMEYLKLNFVWMTVVDVITYVIYVFSSCSTMLWLYRQRAWISNAVYKKRYTMNKQVIYVDKPFRLITPVIKDDLDTARAFFQELMETGQEYEESFYSQNGDISIRVLDALIANTISYKSLVEENQNENIQKQQTRRKSSFDRSFNVSSSASQLNQMMQESKLERFEESVRPFVKDLCVLFVIVNIHKPTLKAYQWLKAQLKKDKEIEVDRCWFMAFAKCHSFDFSQQKSRHATYFPKVEIDQDKLDTYMIKYRDQSFNQSLLVMTLISKCQGVSLKGRRHARQAKGVSIDCTFLDLSYVKVYGSSNAKIYLKQQDKKQQDENIEFKPYPIGKNPSFMKYDVVANCMVIEGKPEKNDKGILAVEITHYLGYVLKRFIIDIEDSQEEEGSPQVIGPGCQIRVGQDMGSDIEIPVEAKIFTPRVVGEDQEAGLLGTERPASKRLQKD